MTKKDKITIYTYSPLLAMQEIQQQLGLGICEFRRAQVCSENFAGKYRTFQFYALTHLYEGRGIYRTPHGREIPVEAGQALLVMPDEIHWYSARKNHLWCEDSVCFQGPLADAMARAGIIKSGLFNFGNTRRLLPIIELAEALTKDTQIKANLALQQLLTALYFEIKMDKNGVISPKINHLLATIRETPSHWWTVEEMAQVCFMNKDYFRRIFIRETGINPKNYIDNIKINLAAKQLRQSNIPLKAIADKLGYIDVYHFSRRFKQLTGVSPHKYRSGFEAHFTSVPSTENL